MKQTIAAVALVLATGSLVGHTEPPEKTGKLLLESSDSCIVRIDGDADKARIGAGQAGSFVLAVGDHIVSATSDDGQVIRKVVTIKEDSQSAVILEFRRITSAEKAKDLVGTWFAHEEWQSKETCRKPGTFMGAYTGKSKMVPCTWSMQQDTTIVISAEQPRDQIVARFTVATAEAHNDVSETSYRPENSIEYTVAMDLRDGKLQAVNRFDWDDPEKAQLLTLRIESTSHGRLAVYQSWTRKGKEPVEPTQPVYYLRR